VSRAPRREGGQDKEGTPRLPAVGENAVVGLDPWRVDMNSGEKEKNPQKKERKSVEGEALGGISVGGTKGNQGENREENDLTNLG